MTPSSANAADALRGIGVVSGIYLLNLLVSWGLTVAQVRSAIRIGQGAMNDLRLEVFAHIQRLSLNYFDRTHQGRILVDGLELGARTVESLHRQLGLVTQENFLFTGTVMDNLRFGRPEATEAEVEAAARRLGTHEVIARLLILDEATSAVDPQTERVIQHALEVLFARRTSFVIADRLSTVRHADLILVLDRGRLLEQGSHTELLTRAGRYAQLHAEFVRNG